MGFGEVDVLLAEGGERAREVGVLDGVVQGEFLVDAEVLGAWALWYVFSEWAAGMGFVLCRGDRGARGSRWVGDGVLAGYDCSVLEASGDVVREVGVDGWNHLDVWWDVGDGA